MVIFLFKYVILNKLSLKGLGMSEYIRMFFNGTEAMFNINSNGIERKKVLIAKNELRIAKAKLKSTVLKRSSNRIERIKIEALS
jgi:hypothetical protein